jgi:hypothetical protein
MRKARDITVQLGLAVAIVALGCGDSNPTSPPREIEVTVTTDNVGGDMDPDGYTLTFDNNGGERVGVNAVVRFSTVSKGRHLVLLTGIAPNCSVEGPNPREVDVLAGEPQTVMITFTVHCGKAQDPSPWDY